MSEKRYLQAQVEADLREKMVFIGGPRQVGKTTLARRIGEERYPNHTYLNWDNINNKKAILDAVFDPDAELVIFDEIHKYRHWKNHIKGLFDVYKDRFHILVTGSARLDLYRRGGDSLMGRYHYLRLHPLSVAEIAGHKEPAMPFQELSFAKDRDTRPTVDRLLAFGGFPEPYFRGDERALRRWHNQRTEKIVKEDIRDLESVRDLSSMQVLASLLPGRVGSPLSVGSLREDLAVSYKTVAHWLDILERFYYHFRLAPYAAKGIHALRKERKSYLWDWSEVPDEGARLENLVASHLLKFCHFLHDAHGYRAELSYLRDRDGHEVDFLVSVDRKPWFAVEVKSTDRTVSKHLFYFGRKLDIPFKYQLVNLPDTDFLQKDVRVMSIDIFLSGLV